jgi:hypothetical protein
MQLPATRVQVCWTCANKKAKKFQVSVFGKSSIKEVSVFSQAIFAKQINYKGNEDKPMVVLVPLSVISILRPKAGEVSSWAKP